MPPRGRNWKELTWSWAYSTGHPASDQKLEAAAHAAWPYAFLCAWAYLNDHDAAVDLMDHAVQNASKYIVRNGDPPPNKLAARIKSVIRRRAGQLAAKRKRELPSGSMYDMEQNTEPMKQSCFRAFPQRHNRSSIAAGSDILGGRSVENLRWTTAHCVVHTLGNWDWCSAVFPLLESPQNVELV
jgi:hypothetical protein